MAANPNVYKSIKAVDAWNRTIKQIPTEKKTKINVTINKIFTLLKAFHS